MDPIAADEMLLDLKRLRLRTRGDRRESSVPLLVVGALALVDASMLLVTQRHAGGTDALPMVPAAFGLIALYYWHQKRRLGIESEARSFAVVALASVLALFLIFGLLMLVGLYVVAGTGLLVVSAKERNWYLACWGAVYGIVGWLEGIYFFSNRLYGVASSVGLFRSTDGYFWWSSPLVFGLLGVATITAGSFARKRESMQP